jgi:hypothetical protein
MRWLPVVLLLALFAGAQEMMETEGKVDFERDVLPILDARCFDCHSDLKRKPKGGLRVDGADFILAGSKKGPVVVPGKPERSPLFTRLRLPEDHEDVMPPGGDPLTKDEQELIRKWIADGAQFGKWKGKSAVGHKVKTKKAYVDDGKLSVRFDIYKQLAKDLPRPPGSAMKAARAAGARVVPVLPGVNLLRVEWITEPDKATDKAVLALAPLRRHVAILGLAESAITDRALAEIGRMPNLVRLDLRRTAITDKGVVALVKANPKSLRWLNLYGTGVTDAGLDALELPGLLNLHVWQTKVTEKGIQRLRVRAPKCKVHWKLELPGAERPRNDSAQRQRR